MHKLNMTDVPQEQVDLDVLQQATEDIQDNVGPEGLLHSPHNEVISSKPDDPNVVVISEAANVRVLNDATQDLLAQAAATVAQEHLANDIVKAEEDIDIVAAASEMVVAADPTVVLRAADTGSILPSDLTAEVAASAAAVAASLNHEHNDLLLSSEIAQIAAESTGNTSDSGKTHEQHLASRRQKDRDRYASMTNEQREAYNKKRREQYHRQSEISRKKRRERERNRYHSLTADKAKERNARRAALERDRYKKLTPAELAERNAKRRERAAMMRARKKAAQQGIDLQNTQQVPDVAANEMLPSSPADLVRVYEHANLQGEIIYESFVPTQDPHPVIEQLSDAIPPTNPEENDESVAV